MFLRVQSNHLYFTTPIPESLPSEAVFSFQPPRLTQFCLTKIPSRLIGYHTTYNHAAAYLNTIFDLLNAHYFESALSRPIITIQSTPKAYGHYTLYDAWSVDGDKGMREINIGAGTLASPLKMLLLPCSMRWFTTGTISTA